MSRGISAADAVGLYIHFPLCRSRCWYCDFLAVDNHWPSTPTLLNAIGAEAEEQLARLARPIRTLFLGGGTPTALEAENLEELLKCIRGVLADDSVGEFTVEANPETLDSERLEILARYGVTRLSIGIQSFQDRDLRFLGRRHDSAQAVRSIQLSRQAGFTNINIDLLYAIPGQSLDDWKGNLQRATATSPEHVSCYALSIPSESKWEAETVIIENDSVDAEVEVAMQRVGTELLSDWGYDAYEVSHFARPGFECAHQLIYWRNEHYLGVGPSAASHVDGVRWRNCSDVDEYIQRIQRGISCREREEPASQAMRAAEAAMMAIRLREGVNVERFTRQFGRHPLQILGSSIGRLIEDGLIESRPDRIMLTESGWSDADRVGAEFIADAQATQP
jgi:oxygen-independent coproporphyrinogen-3 oxidase